MTHESGGQPGEQLPADQQAIADCYQAAVTTFEPAIAESSDGMTALYGATESDLQGSALAGTYDSAVIHAGYEEQGDAIRASVKVALLRKPPYGAGAVEATVITLDDKGETATPRATTRRIELAADVAAEYGSGTIAGTAAADLIAALDQSDNGAYVTTAAELTDAEAAVSLVRGQHAELSFDELSPAQAALSTTEQAAAAEADEDVSIFDPEDATNGELATPQDMADLHTQLTDWLRYNGALSDSSDPRGDHNGLPVAWQDAITYFVADADIVVRYAPQAASHLGLNDKLRLTTTDAFYRPHENGILEYMPPTSGFEVARFNLSTYSAERIELQLSDERLAADSTVFSTAPQVRLSGEVSGRFALLGPNAGMSSSPVERPVDDSDASLVLNQAAADIDNLPTQGEIRAMQQIVSRLDDIRADMRQRRG